MAVTTGGGYYRSSLSGSEIDAISDDIANMDQKEFGDERFTRYEERYQIPLALAFICFVAEVVLSDGIRRVREWRGRFA